MSKDKYKVHNWYQYNEGLKQRGALTLWISNEALQGWKYCGAQKRGGQILYSDEAVETCLAVRAIYRLAFRQTEGFVEAVFRQVHLKLPVPDYTTMSRRAAVLQVEVKGAGCGTITHLVLDSTGLKMLGEGEWKVRAHGYSKRRSWMKLHVALDALAQLAWAVELSTNAVDDAQKVEDLLRKVDAVVHSFTGDGAYDKEGVRALLHQRAQAQQEDILQLMRLQKNAVLDQKGRAHMRQRDEDIEMIAQLGKKEWKVLSGYHQRSLAETFMFRYKVTFGDRIRCRKFANQQTEVRLGAKILNRMLGIAKPKSERVA